MVDKDLIKLLGPNKKYIYYTVILMIIALLANIGITASICLAIQTSLQNYKKYGGEASVFLMPFICALVGLVIRFIASYSMRAFLGPFGQEVKKDLRGETLRENFKVAGLKATDHMSMSGLTQVSMEGIEQLDLYFSLYIPPVFLFYDKLPLFYLSLQFLFSGRLPWFCFFVFL